MTNISQAVGAASAPPSLSVDDAIDRIGIGAFQWRLLAICGLTWAADAMEVLLMGFAMPGISAEFGLQKGSPEMTWLLTATFAGMFVGAAFWGYMADRIGRRGVFLTTVALGVVFGVAGAFAPTVALLMLARFLTGFAIGGTLPVDYAMMAEFVPTSWRGRFLVYLESFWAVGTILVAGLAWFLSTQLPPEDAWRWLLGLAAVPGLIGLLARFGIPDSPRHLLLRGQGRQARAAVEQVAHANGEPQALGEQELAQPAADVRVSPADLLRGSLGRRTVLLGLVWFGLSLGYYGIFSWLPSFLKAGGMDLGAVYRTTLLLALAQLPGYALAAYLVDRIGRRATVSGFLALGAVGAYLFLSAGSPQSVLATSALLSFALLGAWGAVYAYTPELFPTRLRSTGMGLMSSMARAASLISPSVGALLLTGNLSVALTVFALCFAIAAASAWAIGIETRGQQLDDVVA
ncbi:major facilitator superfamily MFS_1 [Deinococcus proteolyticus MRP]|uniref:Major facilitator superfamily MFS_1 n=1 Tax=Deinococcus proteolyticus (strain ATCC 35074 / DSM 20540 / JCM 6276 / NBRC 101906 / NCIMB 13154 / VKM Ac-1939 / CCM 2703 / MRP) TaxID=693977 RepID=F0RLT6_DEIPM|nr:MULTISPECIES: MFS transporter [Deinococcus]ADY25925.1 major facilitator superfamily MFS_1 [Deinococcus proteolyticus MRP]MCY1702046.1 MFS transporter [Deinococcus sp. SL84]